MEAEVVVEEERREGRVQAGAGRCRQQGYSTL